MSPCSVRFLLAGGVEGWTDDSAGKSGLLTLASGLKIATFGGRYDEALFESPTSSAVRSSPVPSCPY